ncbi:MAG TPA: site-specific DNA-methyltransferase [Candidatus Hydrogenedens sp.]|nr:site-specific DNA-methyltransferase [Candidatus Hydrogenedens sp.]
MLELNHLYNMDCLEGMKLIDDKSIDMILCDLPYGTTKCKWDVVIPFKPLWEQYERVIKDSGAIVLFGKEPFSSQLRVSNLDMYRYDWIWVKDTKSNFMQANHQPLNNIELISVFGKGYVRSIKDKVMMTYNPQFTEGKEYKLPKVSKTTDLFGENHKNGVYKHYDRDTSKRYPYNIIQFNMDKPKVHPTQKPVALFEYLIKTYTNEGETVLDNCMGSGTTAIACINTNRNYIGFELDTDYFNIATERIENHKQQLTLF